MHAGSLTSFPSACSAVSRRRISHAFTLVELMISITILVILMMVVTQVIGIVQRNWVRSNARVSQFREARVAFDTLTRNLSQATLNTYWESASDPFRTDSAGQQVTRARANLRQSELQFVCGPTTNLLTSASGSKENYPGHAVFFQAPLGVTRLVAATAAQANTENMVNLLCGRGYFVEWGDDQPYRPPFLNQLNSVPPRFRLRLMEYSPTAEMNRIYADGYRLIDPADRTKIINSRKWFQDALTSTVQQNEQVGSRAFTRPIAENILTLVISPRTETTVAASGGNVEPYAIARQYEFDSTLVTNPGSAANTSLQGTQHQMPPLLKVTMVALDQRGGESLSSNATLRQKVLDEASGLFTNAADYESDLEGTDSEPGKLKKLLLDNKLDYRVFTTTIALKQARWSF
jgi:uncharacterized protein (TIGR02599 family)